jgi:hypothetical protein
MVKPNRFNPAFRIVMVIFLVTLSLSTSAFSPYQSSTPKSSLSQSTLAGHHISKLSSRLYQLATTPSLQAANADVGQPLGLPNKGPASLMRNAKGQFMVDVRMKDVGDAAQQALSKIGVTIVHVSPTYQTVTVYADIASFEAIAALPSVLSVQEELQPLVSGDGLPAAPSATTTITCPWGAARSEGDTQLKANLARSTYGLDGSGVKVGILSDSYAMAAPYGDTAALDVSTGDLPGAGNPCGYTTPVQVAMDDAYGYGSDEGRAMLQVVHDLAPAATLSFATADDGLESFADNIRTLRLRGADIIADDVFYFVEPFFQDGPVSVAISDVVNNGGLYFTSAGNSNYILNGKNVASYETAAFRATPCPFSFSYATCHEFNSSFSMPGASGFTLAAGGQVFIDLQWAEPWFGVTNDFDLYVTDSSGSIVAASTDSNPSSGTPFEIVGLSNTSGSPQTYYIFIYKYSGSSAPRMKYTFYETYGLTDVQVGDFPLWGGDIVGPAIGGHSASSAAFSVAAVPYNDSTTPEWYSSRGPAAHYFAPVSGYTTAAPLGSPEVIQQPDFAATDGGCTTAFFGYSNGCYRFYGTSEAAPHAAAVTALLKQKANQLGKTLTRALLKSTLQSTATSMSGGNVNSVGAGMLNALAAATALGNPIPTITTLSPNYHTAGYGAFTLTVNGTKFVSGSVVYWNGVARTTTYVSASKLTAAISAADIATAGTIVPVTVHTPAPGGGISNAVNFTVYYPIPTLTSLSPSSATPGGAAFTLTVNGTNFVNGSVVRWNGVALTTTYVSAIKLTAAVPAADIASPGTYWVTVFNPTPGGGTSSVVNFKVQNPVPTITTLSPTYHTAGYGAFTLTVNGTNFVNGAVVRWNGSARTTTYVSATKLTAAISAADIAAGGTIIPVTVLNPAPGGGTSNAVNFTVNNPIPTLTSLSPSSATHGGAAFTLTVNGTNFNNHSVVRWNGVALTTTYVSATKLTAAVPAADIATAGTKSVTVFNPTPGGGTSNVKSFTVN